MQNEDQALREALFGKLPETELDKVERAMTGRAALSATPTTKAVNPLAIDALRNNQRQLDIDGCEVGVSRQALDELLDAYTVTPTSAPIDSIKAPLPAWMEDTPVNRAKLQKLVSAPIDNEALVEEVARAICRSKGLSPDCLYQHNFEGDYPEDDRQEYLDAFTGEKRVMLFHRSWRHSEKAARAVLALPSIANYGRGQGADIAELSPVNQAKSGGVESALAEEAIGALEWYAEQFCEYGSSDDGCGKYGDDICSGCKARATLAKLKEGRAG